MIPGSFFPYTNVGLGIPLREYVRDTPSSTHLLLPPLPVGRDPAQFGLQLQNKVLSFSTVNKFCVILSFRTAKFFVILNIKE